MDRPPVASWWRVTAHRCAARRAARQHQAQGPLHKPCWESGLATSGVLVAGDDVAGVARRAGKHRA